jgi:hypothetical protein
MNRRTLLKQMPFLAALGATAPSSLQAQSPAQIPAEKVAEGQSAALKLLKLMDTDKSGKVSRAEFMAFMTAEFDRLDLDHDGELDVRELEQLEINHRGGHTR